MMYVCRIRGARGPLTLGEEGESTSFRFDGAATSGVAGRGRKWVH